MDNQDPTSTGKGQHHLTPRPKHRSPFSGSGRGGKPRVPTGRDELCFLGGKGLGFGRRPKLYSHALVAPFVLMLLGVAVLRAMRWSWLSLIHACTTLSFSMCCTCVRPSTPLPWPSWSGSGGTDAGKLARLRRQALLQYRYRSRLGSRGRGRGYEEQGASMVGQCYFPCCGASVTPKRSNVRGRGGPAAWVGEVCEVLYG